MPHAATVRDGPLLGALGILELIPVKLGVEYAGQHTGRREVVAVILPETLLLVHWALGCARVGRQRSGRHVILIPLAGGAAGHEAAQRIQRVRLTRCRGVRYDCDNSSNEKLRSIEVETDTFDRVWLSRAKSLESFESARFPTMRHSRSTVNLSFSFRSFFLI